ncbi:hypothetical protein [Streptomyces sp. NPDC059072]|uniref:hypothetical protein n=1 Tax=Streptomyces sp. NPDC059072 TaxID=3346715 RepID=UPI0036BC52D2
MGLFAGVASALEVGGALEREREYQASPVCAAVPVTASACVWEQSFTARDRDTHKGEKGKEPEATLLLPSGKPWDVVFRTTDPVLTRLRPGDPSSVWSGTGASWRCGTETGGGSRRRSARSGGRRTG